MLYHALTGKAADRAHRHIQDPLEAPPRHPTLRRRRGAGTALVVAAGLTPCASAIIVLLFALANGVYLVGIGAALAMSAGMALTVSAVGVTSVLGRRLAERLFAGAAAWASRLERALAIAGPLLIVGSSALLLLGAWSQL
jgi:ABC-type nickel/cobalt efflux system permease component RcnA